MRAPWLADVLRSVGLTVVEQPGWRGRGREMDDIVGVMMHHTASSPRSTLQTNLNVVTNGNAVAPGPIAQVMFYRDAVAHIIADGRANHAGAGGPWDDWLPAGAGNARLIGFECVNDGVGEQWSADLVIAMEIGAAAVLRHLGRNESRCIMHSEWAPTRKIDPAGPNPRIDLIPGNRSRTWSGDSFRSRVARWMAPTPVPPPVVVPPPTESEEDPMQAATLWRHPSYLNVFLIGAGPAVNVSPQVFASLVNRGVPQIVEAHDQLLRTCLHQSGLSPDQLVLA